MSGSFSHRLEDNLDTEDERNAISFSRLAMYIFQGLHYNCGVKYAELLDKNAW